MKQSSAVRLTRNAHSHPFLERAENDIADRIDIVGISVEMPKYRKIGPIVFEIVSVETKPDVWMLCKATIEGFIYLQGTKQVRQTYPTSSEGSYPMKTKNISNIQKPEDL